MKFDSYIDAISYIRENERTAEDTLKSYYEQVESFNQVISAVEATFRKLDEKKHIGSTESITVARGSFINKLKSFTAAEICDYIRKLVNTVEKLLAGEEKYYSDKSKQQENLNNLIYYSTNLYVINEIFSMKDKQIRLKFIEDIKAECRNKLNDMYNSVYEDVKHLIKPCKTDGIRNISSLSDKPSMPGDYSEDVLIPIGTYESKDAAWVSTAVDILADGSHDSNYKRLIYQIAEAHRERDILSLNVSTAGESNNILIHQQKYSIREIDDRKHSRDDRVLIELLENIMCRYINALPRISKQICVVQHRMLSELETFVNNIYTKCKDLVFTAHQSDNALNLQNIDATLRGLLLECKYTKETLSLDYRNLYEYNSNNYRRGIWRQMTLLVIKDYPVGFNENAVEALKCILQDANKFGINVVMTVCDDLLETAKNKIIDVDYNSVFDYFNAENSFYIHESSLVAKNTYQYVSFEAAAKGQREFNFREYLDNIEHYISNSYDPAIPLQSLINTKLEYEADERRRNFSRVLDFPIGKIGTFECNMKLYQSGGGSPHVVIAGTTGSGKSVLLHDIILSAACHYSPDELEIYLFDFKETPKGFDRYKKGLPHVKKIATQCKERDIHELLLMIQKIYTDRMKLVGEQGFSDIGKYNEFARNNGKKQIPRMMVVIDEYQTITSDDCIELLLSIAQKGREFGVVLIMAAQSNSPGGFVKILELFGHRFEFKNEPIGKLISGASRRSQELEGPKGLCFYSSDGSAGLPVLLRCAYVNDSDNNEAITYYTDYIAKRFGNRESQTYKVGDVKRIIRSIDYDAKLGTFKLLSDNADLALDSEIDSEYEWLQSAEQIYTSKESLKNRGFILRLGLNSVSLNSADYKLDRQNPYLLLCGDSQRLKSVEYSVIKSAVMAANESKGYVVYYIEGDKKFNVKSPVYALKNRLSNVRFISPEQDKISVALSNIYNEYLRRKDAASDEDYSPMLIMLSSFDSLFASIEESKHTPVVGGERIDSTGLGSNAALDAILAAHAEATAKRRAGETDNKEVSSAAAKSKPHQPQEIPKKDNISDKLDMLLSADLYKYDIFLCIQASDVSCAKYLKSRIRSNLIYSILYLAKDNIIKLELDEEIPRMMEFAKAFAGNTNVKIKKDDICLSYAYKLSLDGISEFIPYEYKNIEYQNE